MLRRKFINLNKCVDFANYCFPTVFHDAVFSERKYGLMNICYCNGVAYLAWSTGTSSSPFHFSGKIMDYCYVYFSNCCRCEDRR